MNKDIEKESEGDTDVENIQSQQRISRNEQLFQLLQTTAGMGYYSTDLSTGIWDRSPVFNEIFGIDEQYSMDAISLTSLIHHDDRQRLTDYHRAIMTRGRKFDTEYRLIRPNDGQERWIHSWGVSEKDDTGNPIRIVCFVMDITENKKLENDIRIGHQRLMNIIEFLPDATFVIDENKRVVAWNLACEVMTGVKKEDILGLGDYAYAEPFFEERRPILIDLLDIPSAEVEAIYKYVRRTGDIIYAESFIPRLRSGKGSHLWGTAAPLFDQSGRRCGAIEVIRDVTEQKHIEQALRESEIKHRTLFETADDAIMLMSNNLFTDCNSRTLRMFGCSREQIVGASPYEYSPPTQPDGRNSEEKALEKIYLAMTEGPQFFEWEHCRQDRTTFMAEVSLNRLKLGGEIMLQSIVRDISGRRKAEDDAKLASTLTHYLSKYANDFIILLDENFRFLEVNERMVDFYGYTYEELIGMHASQLRAPETKDDFVKQTKVAQVSGNALYETIHKSKDGREFPVEISLRAIDNDGKKFYQAVIRDITERKENEKALNESERKYRELVEHANSIILRWTHEGRITFLNEFGQRFFGYSSDEIIGRHVMETIVPQTDSSGQDLRHLMDQICADPVAFEQNVNENIRRNGEHVWIAWTNRIVRDVHGQVSEIQSVGTDITKLKQAEEAIRELNTSLELRVARRTSELAVARDRAEAADRLKSSFLATMSHELRTPLNSIIGFTGIILQGLAGPLNSEQHKQLEMVRDSARHLLELINDVLDISKIEAGQLEVYSESFDLRASIEKVIGIVKPLADKKGLNLKMELAEETDSWFSDSRRVEQVLLNLLNNALKFTEKGMVTLTTKVMPYAAGSADYSIRISITDTGIGIKPENFNKIFQPFRQIDSGLSRQHEGTGLGLAICRRLAELLGGEIHAESDWGKGSIFTLILPMKGPGKL